MIGIIYSFKTAILKKYASNYSDRHFKVQGYFGILVGIFFLIFGLFFQ